MRIRFGAVVTVVLAAALAAVPARSGFLDKLFGGKTPSDDKIVAGLKEALGIGTGNAVASTGKLDGFFGNEAIRIPMPEKLQKLDRGLRTIGLGSEIDAFVLSMNRAAERAAPAAKSIFSDALKEMTISDANKILKGTDTAATDFFRGKTTERLTGSFLPVVSSALTDVGATRRYKDLVGRYASLPFMNSPSLDLDRYVTGKALDGLFLVLGEEERKIRKDPSARVTKLLKDVFAHAGR